VTGITGNELLPILERAVSGQTAANVGGGGQFLQLSGLEVVYDVTQPAQVVTADGQITAAGARIVSILLDPNNDRTGQLLYDVAQGGFLFDPTAPLFDLATINFTANGGDNFATLANIPQDRKFTLSGVTYQQALEQYIRQNLSGTIDAADIPSGEGIRVRDITSTVAAATPGEVVVDVAAVPEPGTIAGIAAALSLGYVKRRQVKKKQA